MMTDKADDDAFSAVHGEHFFDVHTAQFSEGDLKQLLHPETMVKLQNWIQAGYVKPDMPWKHPRGGKERRGYSIVEICRINIIDSLVNGIGIAPSKAVEVADFAIPFLNDRFDRHADGVLKSKAHLYIYSWLDRSTGRMKSSVAYLKPPDTTVWYADDPFLNPDAKPYRPPAGMCILTPISDFFNAMFTNCAKYLVNNKRGAMDKFRRPVDVG